MKLSKRLLAAAGLVTGGASVADIGTDHGYVPIYLVSSGICPEAIAMDVNIEPLMRAREHIREYGLSGQIHTRLSDGLAMLTPGEAQTMIAAGMGGGLMRNILEGSPEVVDSLREFILQPQSEIKEVRKYLNSCGLRIEAEDMVEEDGKFYPMMRAVHGEKQDYSEAEYCYGKLLMERRHPVLRRYLEKEIRIKSEIADSLQVQGGARAKERLAELRREIGLAGAAFSVYEKGA